MIGQQNKQKSKTISLAFMFLGIVLCLFGGWLFYKYGFEIIKQLPKINGYYLSTTGVLSVLYGVQTFSKQK